jgi:hypothetical protein
VRPDSGRRVRLLAHAVRLGCAAGPCRLADVLDGFRERGQHAHPRQVVLARWLGVCTRTVRRWTVELERAGVLDVERHTAHHHHETGRWRRRTNGYRCRFRNSKPPTIGGNMQVTPRGHSCPQDDLSSTSRDGRPTPAPPPAPTYVCPDCGHPVSQADDSVDRGRWRHGACIAAARRAPRPPVVP